MGPWGWSFTPRIPWLVWVIPSTGHLAGNCNMFAGPSEHNLWGFPALTHTHTIHTNRDLTGEIAQSVGAQTLYTGGQGSIPRAALFSQALLGVNIYRYRTKKKICMYTLTKDCSFYRHKASLSHFSSVSMCYYKMTPKEENFTCNFI